MGTLFDLLKAATAGKSDTLAKWRQTVSNALDGGAGAPQYALARGSAAQAAVGFGTTLELETDGAVNGIPRDPGSGDGWLLTPGNLYLLTAAGFFDTFSDTTTGSIRIGWVDDTGTALVTAGAQAVDGIFVPATATAARSTANAIPNFLYLCPAGDPQRVIKLVCGAASGTANKPASSWAATILQIPNGA